MVHTDSLTQIHNQPRQKNMWNSIQTEANNYTLQSSIRSWYKAKHFYNYNQEELWPRKKKKKKTLLSFHTSTLFFCAYAHCPCSVIWLRLWHKHLVPVSFTLSMIECLLHACESVAASQLIVALCTVKQTKRTQKLRSHSKFKLEMINICDYWIHLMWEWMPVSPSQDKK